MHQYIRFVIFFSLLQIIILTTTAQERIHIHTDKDLYLPGETIWFKAYVYRNNQLSFASTNFFIGFYDKAGKLLEEKHYPLFDGVCDGDLQVPDSLKENFVQIRAFTKYIALNDTTNIYRKIIPVFQKSNNSLSFSNIADSLLLTAKAEGTVAVAGMPNYFFLKAIGIDGRPAKVEGIVVADPGNITLDSFDISSSGLSTIQLTPKHGFTYKLKWLNSVGLQKEILLPVAQQAGIVLHTETQNNILYYNIQKSENSKLWDTVILEMSRAGDLFYKAAHPFKNQVQLINKIPLDSVDAGVYEVSLKEKTGLLLQKKYIYVAASYALPLIQPIETNFGSKGKNIFRISFPKKEYSNVSVSVYDANFYSSDYSASIYNDLFGIENNKQHSAKSFKNLRDSDIELLLNFETVNTNIISRNNIDDKYLSVQLKPAVVQPGIMNEPLTVIIKDGFIGNKFLNILPTDNFKYRANDLIFFDTAKLYYQLTNNNKSTLLFDCLVPNEFHMPKNIKGLRETNIKAGNSVSSEEIKLFELKKATAFNGMQTIQTVTVKSKRQNPIMKRFQELDDKYASGMFKGLARGYQLNVLDDPSAEMQSSVINYIKYRIPPLYMLQNTSISSQFKDLDDLASFIFINETESPFSMLESLPMSQVSYIKYIPGIVIGSSFVTSRGALYIYTKKGDEPQNLKETITRKSVLIKGYDISKGFNLVRYNTNSKMTGEDYRSTLYWNPNISFDAGTQSIDIEYYNNDISKKHKVVIKGINEKGEVFEIQKTFQ